MLDLPPRQALSDHGERRRPHRRNPPRRRTFARVSRPRHLLSGLTLFGLTILGGQLIGAASSQAEELGTLLQQKLTLERQFTTAINQALAHLVDPKRAFATVSVDLETRLIRQTVTKRGAHAMSFTVGTVSSEKYVKLPGLPRMRPGKLSEPVRIRIDPKKKRLTHTSQIAVVKRLRVRLYADAKLSKKRLDVLKEAIHSVAGLQKKRGDTISIVPFTFQRPPPKKIVVPAERPSYWLSIAAIPLAMVIAALILGVALVQRRRAVAEGGVGGHVTEHISVHGGPAEGAKERRRDAEDEDEGSVASAQRHRLLPAIMDLSHAELIELLSTLAPKDASLVLALAPLATEDLGAVIDELTRKEGFSKIAADVAVERMVDIEEITALARRIDDAIESIRNPEAIPVGAPDRLGALLRATSRRAARDVLAALEATKPKLLATVRDRLFQFEDLPKLPTGLRRRLVAAVDTEDLAKALVGADKTIVASIHDVLSRRLERILREEERALGDEVSPEDIEAARETLQRAVHALEGSDHA